MAVTPYAGRLAAEMLCSQGVHAATRGWKGRIPYPTDLAGGHLGDESGMQLQQIQAPFSGNGGKKPQALL